MYNFNRRFVIAGTLGTALALTACAKQTPQEVNQGIDTRVDAALVNLYDTTPGARDLADKSVGMLVMPLITEAGFGFGGSFGQGALRIQDVSVDYYSVIEGSFGAQIGAQQFSYVLFFMTEEALAAFRQSSGLAAGADLKMTVMSDGEQVAASTKTSLSPVVGVVFGRAGVIAGATIEGSVYQRLPQ